MNLTYKDVVESKTAVEGLLQLKPPPTAAVAAKIAINARQVTGAIEDFSTAQKALFDGHAVETDQVAGFLFALSTEAQAAQIADRLNDGGVRPVAIQEELAEDDGAEVIEVDWGSHADLAAQYGESVADAAFACESNRATEPLPPVHGVHYVFFLTRKETHPIVPADSMAAYREEIGELLAQDVELRIRPISMAELERCEEKRPGFELEAVMLYGAWFMFDLGGIEDGEPD